MLLGTGTVKKNKGESKMKNKKQTTKKATKKVVKKEVKKQSIAKLVMGMIAKKEMITDSNRKRHYDDVLAAVLELNPTSKFSETHFHWYLSRFARQQRLEMAIDCLHKIDGGFKPLKKKVKKIKKVNKIKKGAKKKGVKRIKRKVKK